MIYACGCHCGNVDENIRRFLKESGYKRWETIEIPKGKDASIRLANLLPPVAETEMLLHFLKEASQWEVIIGTNGKVVRWANLGVNWEKSSIEARAIIDTFA